MERKIFNKSYKSRIKCDLGFFPCYWSLRSIYNVHYDFFVGCITLYGNVDDFYNWLNCGIVPTCII